jgi:hypothetical protein
LSPSGVEGIDLPKKPVKSPPEAEGCGGAGTGREVGGGAGGALNICVNSPGLFAVGGAGAGGRGSIGRGSDGA